MALLITSSFLLLVSIACVLQHRKLTRLGEAAESNRALLEARSNMLVAARAEIARLHETLADGAVAGIDTQVVDR